MKGLEHDIDKAGKLVTRPRIIKLAYTEDKTFIHKAAKNMNKYNQTRRKLKQSPPHVFITDHSPSAFQKQRKKLIPYFNKARADNRKTKRQIENREYCLFIDKRVSLS